MADSKTPPRAAALRSVSVDIRRRHVTSTTAGRVVLREAGGATEDVTALRMQLQERTEQVERLRALVSEKRLIQRQNETFGERVCQHEEQLAQLALAVRGGKSPSTKQQKTSSAKDEKGAAVETTDKAPTVSLREILDDVYQLRYEKHRLEGALAKKERELDGVRAELQQARETDETQKILPLSSVAETNVCSTTADPKHTSPAKDSAMVSLERKLTEMRESYIRVQSKLVAYQKEYHSMRQVLREREKEVLQWQRKHRDIVGTRSKGSLEIEDSNMLSAQWKDAKNMVSSRHRSFFHGADWLQILNEKPEAMRTAFLKDASLELCAPCGFLSVVKMEPGSDFVAIEVEVRRPSSLADDKVELFLLHCPFTEMQRLRTEQDAPKDGWDLVQSQLNEAQKLIATREQEATELQKKLQQTERFLAEHCEEREADDRWVHEALDETEKTVVAMYNEVKEQREKEKTLEAQLKSATESLECHEQEIAELRSQLHTITVEAKQQEENAAQQLEEVRRRASTEIHDVEEKRRQELSALQQQQQQQLRRAAETSRLVTHSLTLHCGPHDEAAMSSLLNSKESDILRALVLNEAAIAANAIPGKVVSLTCVGNECRAEVQLKVNTLSLNDASVAENVHHCQAFSATLFLQEWFDTKAVVEDRNKEIERLSQELKTNGNKVEELLAKNAQLTSEAEVKLCKERVKAHDAEKRRAAIVEEISCIQKALGSEETSQPLPERVACLVKAVAEAEKISKEHEKKLRIEQARAMSLEKQLRGNEKDKCQQQASLEEKLRESKEDLEKATEALKSLQSEHQKLLKKHTSIQALLDGRKQVLIEMEAARQHKPHMQKKKEDDCTSKGAAKSTEKVVKVQHTDHDDDVVIAALHRAYLEYDELYERLESFMHELQKTEKLQQETLQQREEEGKTLRQQLATLQKQLHKGEEKAMTVVSHNKHRETEREELLDRNKKEMHALSKRLAGNDALQRETETAKKALELQVAQLQQQCDVHKAERKQFQEASVVLETERAALEKKVEELQQEMKNRTHRAEKIMRQLVIEEDKRRAMEIEMTLLQRSKTATRRRDNSRGKEESIRSATTQEVKRLRNFCIHTLKLPLTEKQQTVSDILAFLEQQRGSVVMAEEEEHMATALLSINTASDLLKQCVAAKGEHKEAIIHRTPTRGTPSKKSAPAASDLLAFSRSLTYCSGGGIAPGAAAGTGMVHSAIPPKLASRKATTPTPFARLASSNQYLQQRQQRSQRKGSSAVVLASAAADVVHLAQLLNVVVAKLRSNQKENALGNNTALNKSSDVLESSRQKHSLIPNEHQQTKEHQHNGDGENETDAAHTDEHNEFVHRSRANALCVALSVKDHLDDALAALQSVLHTFREETYTVTDRFAVDTIHDLRMSEGCVVYALKRISQSADVLFSQKERREIEARRGVDYFSVPMEWNESAAVQSEKGLIPRDVNLSPLQSRSQERPQESCGHWTTEDNQLIQWALLEARRRKR